jgi:cytochrome c
MTLNARSRVFASALSGLLLLQAAVVVVAQTPAPVPAASPAAAVTDTPEYKRGRLLFIQCRACHELKAGLPAKVGPSLHGLLGAKSAHVEGFTYSAALRAANLTWDRATLDRWLERPGAVVPGNSMAFAGVANPKDRAALITYIEAETR